MSELAELAALVCDVIGFSGELVFDTSRPDGTPHKQLDVSKIVALGWRAKFTLEQGLALTYQDFLIRRSE